ncbi:EamA family transporter [Priestia megaterium]|jgi:drug/metabolite transporter (DMT)-like permease|uniref:EamA family transporter n=1 Tax=Priestia megaterium TaxID=1404 RepID=UPI001B3A49ED|nr:EamA family transporter [Priestia megaterium]MBQ4868139.1 EamA family transporter [Priestia megaterium]
MNSIPLLLIMTLLGSVGAVFFKYISTYLNEKKIKLALICFVGGGLFYGTAALLNVYVLTLLPYSIVFPLTSITYIWTLTFGYFLIKEKVTTKQVIGCILLIVGCFFIANS